MIELMIDLETLGTKPGCAILSIAAVPFNVHSPLETFYERVDAKSCIESGLHINPDTVAWWAKQPKDAYDEAMGGSTRIESALLSLSSYIKQLGTVRVWGNGASFDAPILEAAYEVCKLPVPWKYYNSMCYRTLKNLFKQIPAPENMMKHNALYDAMAQAAHAEKIFKFVKS